MGRIERTEGKIEIMELRVYQGAYASIWMSIEVLGTRPTFKIIDNRSGKDLNDYGLIQGVDWHDLRQVMHELDIYELDLMEAGI